MKLRVDFVSNSSSCSFIIRLKNDEDRKMLEEVKKFFPIGVNFYDVTYDFLHEDDAIEAYKRGEEFIEASTGDDDRDEHIELLSNLYYKMNELHNFDVYEDEWAHYSHGKKWKGFDK